jgi:hypothetical protein
LLELMSVESMSTSCVPFQAMMAFCPDSDTRAYVGEKPPLSACAGENSVKRSRIASVQSVDLWECKEGANYYLMHCLT